MPLSEADTRAKLIDSALHARGWTADLIRREETAGAVDMLEGKARRRARGRTDYTLRVKVSTESSPGSAIIEAKDGTCTGHGLEQPKHMAPDAAQCGPASVNGHLFVEFAG